MLCGCWGLVLIFHIAPSWKNGRWYYTSLIFQITTLTFCNFHCFRGEKSRGIVIGISHLYLDHSCTRKPGYPFICGLYNQAGLENNQGMLSIIQRIRKQHKYEISSLKFKNELTSYFYVSPDFSKWHHLKFIS